jgi:hypothetical protein
VAHEGLRQWINALGCMVVARVYPFCPHQVAKSTQMQVQRSTSVAGRYRESGRC